MKIIFISKLIKKTKKKKKKKDTENKGWFFSFYWILIFGLIKLFSSLHQNLFFLKKKKLKKEKFEKLFLKFDSNKNGSLDMEEWKKFGKKVFKVESKYVKEDLNKHMVNKKKNL